MTFEERIKIEARAALQELISAKVDTHLDNEPDVDNDPDVEEEEESDRLDESLIAVGVGATVAAVAKLVNMIKKGQRDKLKNEIITKLLPDISRDIGNLQRRSKMLTSAADLDSFEKATANMISRLSTAAKEAKTLQLTEKEINRISFPIRSPEKRLEKFRNEMVKLFTDSIKETEEIEAIAMRELNVRLGIDG